MTDTTARRALYLALMTDGITGNGHSPDRSEQATALIEAFRDEDRATHRKQVLTEAAELIQAQRAAVYTDAGQKTAEGLDRARDLLLAARTTTAQEN